jgi:hypothetical protein
MPSVCNADGNDATVKQPETIPRSHYERQKRSFKHMLNKNPRTKAEALR